MIGRRKDERHEMEADRKEEHNVQKLLKMKMTHGVGGPKGRWTDDAAAVALDETQKRDEEVVHSEAHILPLPLPSLRHSIHHPQMVSQPLPLPLHYQYSY